MARDADDPRCLGFQGQNSDLPVFFESALWIRFQRESGHIHMSLQFPPHRRISLDDIREAWPAIAEWQKRLEAHQGPWQNGGEGRLFGLLHTLHEDGVSYAQLAEYVNRCVVRDLREYLVFRRSGQEAFGLLDEELRALDQYVYLGADAPCTPLTGNQFGREHAMSTLVAMGLSEAEASEWCDAILENLAAGEAAYEEGGGPVARDHIISRLRAWRARPGVVKIG